MYTNVGFAMNVLCLSSSLLRKTPFVLRWSSTTSHKRLFYIRFGWSSDRCTCILQMLTLLFVPTINSQYHKINLNSSTSDLTRITGIDILQNTLIVSHRKNNTFLYESITSRRYIYFKYYYFAQRFKSHQYTNHQSWATTWTFLVFKLIKSYLPLTVRKIKNDLTFNVF